MSLYFLTLMWVPPACLLPHLNVRGYFYKRRHFPSFVPSVYTQTENSPLKTSLSKNFRQPRERVRGSDWLLLLLFWGFWLANVGLSFSLHRHLQVWRALDCINGIYTVQAKSLDTPSHSMRFLFIFMTISIVDSHWRHQNYEWTHMELCT